MSRYSRQFIIFLFLCFVLNVNLEASANKTKPLYEKLSQESPDSLARAHLLQEVNLSNAALHLEVCDTLLLGSKPLSLVRSCSKLNRCDLALGSFWYLQIDPTWKVSQKSKTEITIEIPTPLDSNPRYVLTLTKKKPSKNKVIWQLSSQDGPLTCYTFVKDADHTDFQLSEVKPQAQDPICYTYQTHPLTQRPLLASATQDGVCVARYTYDEKGRLTETWHPLGVSQAPVCALKCTYEENAAETLVHTQDAEGAVCCYHFSPSGKLSSIDTLLSAGLMRIERFSWQEDKLSTYSIHDPAGCCLGARVFTYTKEGKLARSTLLGNLSGLGPNTFSLENLAHIESCSTCYTYDALGRLSEKKQEETRQLFHYLGDSRLITARYTLCNESITQRVFYQYDHEGNCLKCIQDDGSSMDPQGLQDVKKRVILSQTFHTGLKGKGLPYLIDTLHLDIESGQEKLDGSGVCLYDCQGHLVQKQQFNAKGQLLLAVSYAYDSYGRLIVEEQLEGPKFTYIYQPRCVKILCSQKSGASSLTYRYDYAGRVITEESEPSDAPSSAQYRYTPFGFCLEQTNALGVTTSFSYDALGRKLKEKRPAISIDDMAATPILEWEYDLLDRPFKYKDAEGYTTEIACTLYGHPCHKQYPDGSFEKMRYTLAGHLIETCNRLGKHEQTHAQIAPQPTPSPLPFQPATCQTQELKRQAVQNALGQWVIQEIRQRAEKVEISTYDALNQLTQFEEKDNLGNCLSLRKMRYDKAGHCILEQWFRKEQDPFPYTIARVFGPMDRLESVTEGVGTTRARKTCYLYDAAGRLECLIKPDGCRLFYTYDDEGRLATLRSSDESVSYAYTYDTQHNPIAIYNLLEGSCLLRCYDGAGRLLEEKLSSGHRFTYAYDLDGNLAALTYPDDSQVHYTYEEQALSSIIRKSASGHVRYTQSFTRQSGTGVLGAVHLPLQLGDICYQYDSAGKKCALSSDYYTQSLTFCEAAKGMIASETRSDPAGSYTTHYTHDAKEQLIEERSDSCLAPASKAYLYDLLGNRLLTNGKSAALHANNDLESSSTAHYTYDLNGNRIRAEGSFGTYLYTYDALDHLTAIEKPACMRAVYTYDPFHRRTGRSIYNWNPSSASWELVNKETFLYQGDLEAGCIDTQGSLLLRVLLPNTPAEAHATVSIEKDQKLYIPVHDLHGSICVLVDANTREVAEYYRRDGFGREIIYQPGETPLDPLDAINPWRMEGKRHDAESGFVYYGRRFYDPSIGLWLTKDPMGDLDGAHDTLFVKNNPLHRTDRHGLFSLSKWWHTLADYTTYAVNTVRHAADNVVQFLLHDHKIIDTLRRDLAFIQGAYVLKACNFYTTAPNSGVYGNGELSNTIRFSYVNGMLNTHDGVLATLQKLSEAHGGANIHYTYRPTEGWSLDLLKSFLVIKGYTSPTAVSLVGMWRELIAEMGGIEANGTIIHYAHSLGSAETLSAQSMLTLEEQQKIRVFTFGSPVLIPDTGFASVTNYISRCDFVSAFDPYRYFSSLFGAESNIVFVGDYGFPMIDHYICHKNYMRILTGLGRFFARSTGHRAE